MALRRHFETYCESVKTVLTRSAPISDDDGMELATKRSSMAIMHSIHGARMPPARGVNRRHPRKPSVRTYLDKISLTGLHNYLYSEGRLEARFWIFVMLLATGGTMCYLVPTIGQYLEFTTVIDISHKVYSGLRIPNPYVCTWGFNYSYFVAEFDAVQYQLYSDKRAQLLARRLRDRLHRAAYPVEYKGVEDNVGSLIDNAIWYILSNPNDDLSWVDVIYHETLDEAIQKAVEFAGGNVSVRRFYEDGMLRCESALKNCTLNGRPIDCCADSSIGQPFLADKCFKIDIRKELLNGSNNYGSSITLSLETITDISNTPSVYNEAQSIGISLQDHMPSAFDLSDVRVAAGTTSVITVRAKQTKQMYGCMNDYRYNPNLHYDSPILLQQYFGNMALPDQYHINTCTEAKMIEWLSNQCNCVPYFKTMQPDDSSICTPTVLNTCFRTAVSAPPESDSPVADSSASIDGTRRDVFEYLRKSIIKECLQQCDWWSYDTQVFSMDAEGEPGNISQFWRSKVTIQFEPEYEVHVEMRKMDYHAFIAALGDGLGLIFGATFITFVQAAYWLPAAALLRRRTRKVKVVVEVRRPPQMNVIMDKDSRRLSTVHVHL